jgi:hypothetical protein
MQIGMLWESIEGAFGISDSGKKAIDKEISRERKTK